MYSFASYVASFHLEKSLAVSSRQERPGFDESYYPDDGHLLKAVERTRMIVSTVSTFICANAQRAFKTVDMYTKGKAVKRIIAIKDAELALHAMSK
jgi:hypothetical protein